jgi:hypothetical protein
MSTTRISALCLTLAVMLLALPAAQATLLNPGNIGLAAVYAGLPPVPPPPDPRNLPSLFLVGIAQANWSLPNPLKATGWYSEEVYLNPLTNGLDFYYQVHNNAASADAIEHISVYDFKVFSTNVWFIGGGLTPPSYASRGATGDSIDFWYGLFGAGPLLNPGQTSDWLLVQTNATIVDGGGMSLIDSGSTNVFTYGPTAIPEPATLIMLGSGLVGLAGYVRRRRHA